MSPTARRSGVWSPAARRRPWALMRSPACAEVEIVRTERGALCVRDARTGEAWAYHARSDRDGARWIYRAARRVGAVVRWRATR